MKQLVLLIAVLFTFSCTEKTLQLPETTNNTITEVIDVSPIYMFFSEDTGDIEFNRKNMISTTNWLVNIDKRLTIKQILPHLQYLQKKRQGDGMHKNENAGNYFTCNNTDLKNLSFIEFTKTEFVDKLSKRDSIISLTIDNILINVFIDTDNNVSLKTNHNDIVNSYSKTTFEEGLDSIIQSYTNRKSFYFEYTSDLNFQDYIFFKSKLLNYSNDNIEIKDIEFIHN